ncbi:hypothetical protein CXB36_19830 [Pseudomonas syringae pv. syringae]|nr:hypothetical protein AL063_01915 [Pseudomonas syringae pv. syringae]PBP91803.1 hypothetical protein CCL16_05915 [Pseudomonas syringae]BBN62414.1 hypothetical protein KUIN1_16040 [Pseudomonas sp. KUIN-1]PHN22467.1 hypothetical protein AO256_03740 [Pseudomonas syringae]PHX31273.1 hypothetical protein AO278_09255 [Pseudomonas syringae pv. syringae]
MIAIAIKITDTPHRSAMASPRTCVRSQLGRSMSVLFSTAKPLFKDKRHTQSMFSCTAENTNEDNEDGQAANKQ